VLPEIETKYKENNGYKWHFVSYDSLIGGLKFAQSVVDEMKVHYWKILSSLSKKSTAFTLRVRVVQYYLLEFWKQRSYLILKFLELLTLCSNVVCPKGRIMRLF